MHTHLIRHVAAGPIVSCVAVAALCLFPSGTAAEAIDCGAIECDSAPVDTCCCSRCEVCCPKLEVVDEKKSCWQVKCEKVCIPAIRLPWEPGGSPLTLFNCLSGGGKAGKCVHCEGRCGGECAGAVSACSCAPMRCGTVRTVRVLDEESYEVSTCRYKWEVKSLLPAHCCSQCIDEQQAMLPDVDDLP